MGPPVKTWGLKTKLTTRLGVRRATTAIKIPIGKGIQQVIKVVPRIPGVRALRLRTKLGLQVAGIRLKRLTPLEVKVIKELRTKDIPLVKETPLAISKQVLKPLVTRKSPDLSFEEATFFRQVGVSLRKQAVNRLLGKEKAFRFGREGEPALRETFKKLQTTPRKLSVDFLKELPKVKEPIPQDVELFLKTTDISTAIRARPTFTATAEDVVSITFPSKKFPFVPPPEVTPKRKRFAPIEETIQTPMIESRRVALDRGVTPRVMVLPLLVPKVSLKIAPKALPKVISRVIPKVIPKVLPKTIPKVVPKVIPKVVPKVIPKVIPKIIPKVIPKVLPKVIPKVIPKIIPKLIPKVVPEIVPKLRMPPPLPPPFIPFPKLKPRRVKKVREKKKLKRKTRRQPSVGAAFERIFIPRRKLKKELLTGLELRPIQI